MDDERNSSIYKNNVVKYARKPSGVIDNKTEKRTEITFVLLEIVLLLSLESVNLNILILLKRHLMLNVLVTGIGGN